MANLNAVLPPFPSQSLTMSVRDHDPINKAYPGLDIVSDKVDAEFDKEPTHDTLKRQLKNRHVAMIRYFSTFFSVDLLRLRFVHKVLEVWHSPRGYLS